MRLDHLVAKETEVYVVSWVNSMATVLNVDVVYRR